MASSPTGSVGPGGEDQRPAADGLDERQEQGGDPSLVGAMGLPHLAVTAASISSLWDVRSQQQPAMQGFFGPKIGFPILPVRFRTSEQADIKKGGWQ